MATGTATGKGIGTGTVIVSVRVQVRVRVGIRVRGRVRARDRPVASPIHTRGAPTSGAVAGATQHRRPSDQGSGLGIGLQWGIG